MCENGELRLKLEELGGLTGVGVIGARLVSQFMKALSTLSLHVTRNLWNFVPRCTSNNIPDWLSISLKS